MFYLLEKLSPHYISILQNQFDYIGELKSSPKPLTLYNVMSSSAGVSD